MASFITGAGERVIVGGWAEYEVCKRSYRYDDVCYVGRGYPQLVYPETIINDIMNQHHPDNLMSPISDCLNDISKRIAELENNCISQLKANCKSVRLPAISSSQCCHMMQSYEGTADFQDKLKIISGITGLTPPIMPHFDPVDRSHVNELEKKLVPFMTSLEEYLCLASDHIKNRLY